MNASPIEFRGFTLVELLVVISIIGILVGSTSVVYNNARDKGSDSDRKQDLASIKSALALYFQDNGYFPCDTTPPASCSKTTFTSSETQPWIPGLITTYIQKLPKDPRQAGLVTYLASLFNSTVIKSVYAAAVSEVINPTSVSSLGDKNDWNLGTGSDKVSAVISNDSDSGYIWRGAIWAGDPVSHLQWYNLSDPVTVGSNPISSVEIHYIARASIGGNSNNQIRSNLANSLGNYLSGTINGLTNSTYQEFSDTFATNPTGGTWTLSDVNNLQIGVENWSTGGDQRRVTQIWAVVNFTTPAPTPTPTPTPTPLPSPSGVPGTYMYVVSIDHNSYTLWAQLENTSDPDIYNKPGAACTDTPPAGSVYNYCVKPDF